MRHRVAGRKFGLPTDQRMALLRGLIKSFVEHDSIITTETRAKEVRPMVEKLITLGKHGAGADTARGVHLRRMARRVLNDEDLVKRLFDEIAPKFKDTPGGYTRIIRIGPRRGDAAPMAKLELATEE